MGELVEVCAVEVDEEVIESRLVGANIDSPAAGRRMAAAGLEVSGWALATAGPPEAIEAVLGNEIVARGAQRSRGDLAAAFPNLAGAERAGFELSANVSGAAEEADCELEIRARLDNSVVPFAKLRLRRYWRGELRAEIPPLVSLLVIDEAPRAGDLVPTLASIGDQRHPLTEVLVLQPPDDGGHSTSSWKEDGIRVVSEVPNGGTLRNEGIRRSNGELILFLPAGRRIAPDGLPLAIEMLTRKPAVSSIVDGDREEVAAAIYRRSAFEELEGFADTRGDCDLELARRAGPYGAVFARGLLAAAGA